MKETRELIEQRVNNLLKDVDKDTGLRILKEMVDDLCLVMYGTCVTQELDKVKFADDKSSVIQTLASGRAILISSHGFKVKTDTNCKCGRAFIVLDEQTREDQNKEREDIG